jgi:hypothetical protein
MAPELPALNPGAFGPVKHYRRFSWRAGACAWARHFGAWTIFSKISHCTKSDISPADYRAQNSVAFFQI